MAAGGGETSRFLVKSKAFKAIDYVYSFTFIK